MRRRKDPILAALKTPEDFVNYLKKFGLSEDIPFCADLNEADLPKNGAGVVMSLEQSAGNYSGVTRSADGVLRQNDGGAMAKFSGLEGTPSPEWKRSAAFLQMIAKILLSQRGLSRERRRNLKMLKTELPEYAPSIDLPRIPPELGTTEQFLEEWKGGYLDVFTVIASRSEQTIFIRSTGLHEYEQSAPDDESPEDDRGHFEGLTWIADE